MLQRNQIRIKLLYIVHIVHIGPFTDYVLYCFKSLHSHQEVPLNFIHIRMDPQSHKPSCMYTKPYPLTLNTHW